MSGAAQPNGVINGHQMHGHDAASMDYLLECLILLGTHYGEVTTRDAITSGLPIGPGGKLSPELFSRAASRISLSSKVFKTDLSNVNGALLPAVLLLEGERACLLLELSSDSTAKVIYPEMGEAAVEISAEKLQEQYLGYVIFVQPEFRFDQRTASKRPDSQTQHWFWDIFKKSFGLYRDVLIAALFINMMAVALPLFTMNVYDRVIPNSAVETLWVLAIGVAIVILLDVMLRTIRAYYLDLASKRIDMRLSSDIMEKVLGLRLEARPASSGSFAQNLRSYETIRDFITSATMTAVVDLPFTFIFLALIFWVAGWMVLPPLVGMLVITVFALTTQKKMARLTESTYQASAMRNATLIESLVGLDTVKALAAEGIMQRKWEQTATFLARVSIRLRLLASSNLNVVLWAQQWVTIAVIIAGVYLITLGELSMGGLIACSMLSARAMSPFAGVAGLLTQFHHAKTAMQSLDEIMDKPVERPEESRLVHRNKINGSIEFRNVTFCYPETETPALRNVSFTIKPGERVALLGRIGSGKTSILKLVMGLYQATEGAILIDGVDIRQIDLSELRHQMGYVAQDVTLFYGSLRDNIVMGHPQASDEQVIHAAEYAHLAEFIDTHPRGFDMLIGERGDSISGGQRKSIALARAVLNEPQVLLLDEPTGSMDHSTESWVVEKLKTETDGNTLLISTHRTSILNIVDRIIVIDKGKIVADGPREKVANALREGRIGKAL